MGASAGQNRTGQGISVGPAEVASAKWYKSTKSGYNGSCVEVGELRSEQVCVRDTKAHGAGPVLVFSYAEWNAFLSKVKRGDLDFG